MAAPIEIEVWSLRAGQALTITNPGPAIIIVRAVQVDQAAALVAVLRHQRDFGEWLLPTHRRLKALAKVDVLLTLAVDAHLAIVADHLHHVAYLNVLRDWTWELQDVSAVVLGNFPKEIRQACKKVRRFVVHAVNGTRPDDWLAGKVVALSTRLSKLKTTIALLPPRQQ